jgi:translation initiation factor 2B subunit (eIF-2B alpha/beta/delta family)
VGNLIDLPNAILKFAREQIKRDQMITESEYKRFLVKTPRELGTIEDWWDHLRKQAQKLKAGKLTSVNGADATDEIDRVINAANKRLKDIAKSKGVQPADAKSAAQQAPAATAAA